MEHAAIFIPASPASSAAHTPIKFRTPAPSRSGSIWIPATPPSAGCPYTSYSTSELAWAISLDNSMMESYDPSHRTTSEASSATPASLFTDPIETSSQYLVRMSCLFIDSVNNGDWASAERLAYVVGHSCFTARLPDFPEVNSYWAHVETYKLIQSRAPHVRITIMGTSCEVDEMSGYANVYINAEASGHPGGVSTHGVSIFEWKRTKMAGEWFCIRHTALKGIEGII